jgi:hypothetical protein
MKSPQGRSTRDFERSEKKNIFGLLSFGLLISILRVTFTQDEDMGWFLSISSFVQNGYRLYADIFEIKDPLFFYTAAVSLKIFGTTGPYLIDVALITMSAPIAYLIARSMKLSELASKLSAICFIIVLTGAYYQTFRTQIFGIFMFLLCMLFILKGKWFFAGCAAVAVVGFKMPIAAYLIGLIPLVYALRPTLRKLMEFLLGTLFSLGSLIGLLLLRGEFQGYLNMIRENINYASGYQTMEGMRAGPLGHLLIWDGDTGKARTLLFACFVISYVYIRTSAIENSKLILNSMWGVFGGTFLFLSLTALWPHHLQILSIPVFLITVAVSNALFPNENLDNGNFANKKYKITPKREIRSTFKLALVFLLVVIPINSGATFSLKMKMPLNEWLNHSWRFPPEVELLNSLNYQGAEQINVARLGLNDELGYAAFLDHAKWKYKCNRFGIGGTEPAGIVNDFLNCLGNEVEVVTISPMFINLNRAGAFADYRTNANKIIQEKFRCEPMRTDGYQVCIKKGSKLY